jgi:hypothetical protein
MQAAKQIVVGDRFGGTLDSGLSSVDEYLYSIKPLKAERAILRILIFIFSSPHPHLHRLLANINQYPISMNIHFSCSFKDIKLKIPLSSIP